MPVAEGTIVDFESGQPIEGVFVVEETKKYGEITDEFGNFSLSGSTGGLFGCGEVKIVCTKDGYQPYTQKGGGKIEMKKQ